MRAASRGKQVTLTLPYPPTTNHAYTIARGRKVKTAAARGYAQHVATLTRAQAPATTLTREHRLAVTVAVHPPDRRRRDLANVEKLVVDAVMSTLGLDDSQIDDLRLTRCERVDGGRLIVGIYALAEA